MKVRGVFLTLCHALPEITGNRPITSRWQKIIIVILIIIIITIIIIIVIITIIVIIISVVICFKFSIFQPTYQPL